MGAIITSKDEATAAFSATTTRQAGRSNEKKSTATLVDIAGDAADRKLRCLLIWSHRCSDEHKLSNLLWISYSDFVGPSLISFLSPFSSSLKSLVFTCPVFGHVLSACHYERNFEKGTSYCVLSFLTADTHAKPFVTPLPLYGFTPSQPLPSPFKQSSTHYETYRCLS